MKSVLVKNYSTPFTGRVGRKPETELGQKSDGFMTWLACAILLLNLVQTAFSNVAVAHSHLAATGAINHDTLPLQNDEHIASASTHVDNVDKAKAHCHAHMVEGDVVSSNMTANTALNTVKTTTHHHELGVENEPVIALSVQNSTAEQERAVLHISADTSTHGHNVDTHSDCCGEDCQCSTQHCFGSSVALLHPDVFTLASPLRTLALTALTGARMHTTSSQFRPPKNVRTA